MLRSKMTVFQAFDLKYYRKERKEAEEPGEAKHSSLLALAGSI